MTEQPIKDIVTKARRIAECEQELKELVSMINLLDGQISNCSRIFRELQGKPTVAKPGVSGDLKAETAVRKIPAGC